MGSQHFRRLLTVSDQQIKDLLAQLDASARSDRAKRIAARANRRKNPRQDFYIHDLAIVIGHMGGHKSHLIVSSRNLSEKGMGFLHGGFVHIASPVTLVLRRIDGQLDTIRGEVRSCRYLDGMVHEIGVEFDHEIDLDLYISRHEEEDLGEAMKIPQLPFSLACGEANPSDAALFQHYLSPTGVKVLMSDSSGGIIDVARREDVDLVMLELDLGGSDGIHAIRKLRWYKFTKPIVVVTGDRRKEQLDGAIESGANLILPKPYTGPDLYKAIVEALGIESSVVWTKVLRSTKASDPNVAHLIPQFIEQSKLVSTLLDQACDARELRRVLELVEDLRNEAGRYGFDALQDAAALTLGDLDTHGSVGPCVDQLQRLTMLCRCLSVAA